MTQVEAVLKYMNDYGSITAIDAFKDLGIMRLASRICDIEHMGISIKRVTETSRNRYGDPIHYTRYSIAE